MNPAWDDAVRPRKIVMYGGQLPGDPPPAALGQLIPNADVADAPNWATMDATVQREVRLQPGQPRQTVRLRETIASPDLPGWSLTGGSPRAATADANPPGTTSEMWSGSRRTGQPGASFGGEIVALPMKPGYTGGPALPYGSPIDPEGGGQVPYNAAKVPQSKKGERYTGFSRGIGSWEQLRRQGALNGGPRRQDSLEAEANALLGGNPLANLDRYRRPDDPGDPSFEDGGRSEGRRTTEPVYTTLEVPYKEDSGRWRQPSAPRLRGQPGAVLPYRIDPMADTGIYRRDIIDEPVYIENDRGDPRPLRVGELIETLKNKYKTPVMGASTLQAAESRGEFVRVPDNQRDRSLIGYLRGTPVYEPTDPGPDGTRLPKMATREVAIPDGYGGSKAAPVEEQIFRIGNPMSRDMDGLLAELEYLGSQPGVGAPLQELVRTIKTFPVERAQQDLKSVDGRLVTPVDLGRMRATGRLFSDPHPTTGVMRVMNPGGAEALLIPEVVRRAGGALTDVRTPRYILVQDPQQNLARASSRKAGVGHFLEPGLRSKLEKIDEPNNWLAQTFNPDGRTIWDVLEDIREAGQSQGPSFATRMAGQMAPGDGTVAVQPWIPGLRGMDIGNGRRLETWNMGRQTPVAAEPAPAAVVVNPDQLVLPIQVESQYGRLMRELPAEAFVRPDAELIDAEGPHLGPALTTAYLRENLDDDLGPTKYGKGYGFTATERPVAETVAPFVRLAAEYTGGDMQAAQYVVDSAMRNLSGPVTNEGMVQAIQGMMGRPVTVYKSPTAPEPARVVAQVPSREATAAAVAASLRPPIAEPRQGWIPGLPSMDDALAAPMRPEQQRFADYMNRVGPRAWADWIAAGGDYAPRQQLSLPL